MLRMKLWSALAALAMLAASSGAAKASIIGVAGGTAAPAGTLGPFTMTPFGDDARPILQNETSVASPLGGDVGFSIPLSHREIGAGWATWSHGYTGDVYYSNGATSVTLTLPASTGAFYLYAEPDPFDFFDITAETDSGTSITQSVTGQAGASYYGFYTDAAESIVSITISTSVGFAIGEFGIAQVDAAVPEPSSMALLGLGVAGFGVYRRRRAAKTTD